MRQLCVMHLQRNKRSRSTFSALVTFTSCPITCLKVPKAAAGSQRITELLGGNGHAWKMPKIMLLPNAALAGDPYGYVRKRWPCISLNGTKATATMRLADAM